MNLWTVNVRDFVETFPNLCTKTVFLRGWTSASSQDVDKLTTIKIFGRFVRLVQTLSKNKRNSQQILIQILVFKAI